MFEIIAGNICSIGAMVSDSIAGTRKTRKSMLLIQCISQLFYIASSMILAAYSASVQNVVAIIRNLVATKGKTSKGLAIFLILLPVVLGIYFNNRGAMGLLPVIANLEYSVVMFKFPDSAKALKIALIINCIMFGVFNFYVLNFVSGVSCIVIIISTASSLIATAKGNKSEGQNE